MDECKHAFTDAPVDVRTYANASTVIILKCRCGYLFPRPICPDDCECFYCLKVWKYAD